MLNLSHKAPCPSQESCSQCCRADAVKEDLEAIINALLESELESFLHFSKGRSLTCGDRNTRNGFYERKFKSLHGKLSVRIPRDRAGDFHQQTLPYYLRHCTPADCIFCKLLNKDLSREKTRELLGDLYGEAYDEDFINYLAEKYIASYPQKNLLTKVS